MGRKRQITEYLDIDLDTDIWCCNRCGQELISAYENYKKGCIVFERDPRTIYRPLIEDSAYNFAPDPDWCRIIEFYCPRCGTMIETELLPPGHPITHDIELNLESLKRKHAVSGETGQTLGGAL